MHFLARQGYAVSQCNETKSKRETENIYSVPEHAFTVMKSTNEFHLWKFWCITNVDYMNNVAQNFTRMKKQSVCHSYRRRGLDVLHLIISLMYELELGHTIWKLITFIKFHLIMNQHALRWSEFHCEFDYDECVRLAWGGRVWRPAGERVANQTC